MRDGGTTDGAHVSLPGPTDIEAMLDSMDANAVKQALKGEHPEFASQLVELVDAVVAMRGESSTRDNKGVPLDDQVLDGGVTAEELMEKKGGYDEKVALAKQKRMEREAARMEEQAEKANFFTGEKEGQIKVKSMDAVFADRKETDTDPRLNMNNDDDVVASTNNMTPDQSAETMRNAKPEAKVDLERDANAGGPGYAEQQVMSAKTKALLKEDAPKVPGEYNTPHPVAAKLVDKKEPITVMQGKNIKEGGAVSPRELFTGRMSPSQTPERPVEIGQGQSASTRDTR